MSALTTAIKPRYVLEGLAMRHNPDRSWWADAPREGFTRICEHEGDRMRLGRYGNRACSLGRLGMGTIEMFRARRAMAGRVAHGA